VKKERELETGAGGDQTKPEMESFLLLCLAHGFFSTHRWSRPMWNTSSDPRCSRLGEI